MLALTIKQPWAAFLIDGHKQFETRSWSMQRLQKGDLVAIHTSKTLDSWIEDWMAYELFVEHPMVVMAYEATRYSLFRDLSCFLGIMEVFQDSRPTSQACDDPLVTPLERKLGFFQDGQHYLGLRTVVRFNPPLFRGVRGQLKFWSVDRGHADMMVRTARAQGINLPATPP